MKMSAVSASSMRRPLPFRAFRATSACLLTFAIASGLLAAPATAGPDSTSPPTEQGLQQPTPSASALAPEDAPVLAEQPAPVAEPALEVPSRLATPSNVPVEFAQSPSSPGATMGQVAKEQRAAVEGTNPAPLSGPANQAQADLVAPALAGIPAGVPGMDVSGWQADAATHSRSTVDWSWQRSMGSRFVYAKGSEGDYFADASRVSHLQGATATGMLHGAYHFALPSQSSATRQADFFLANGGSWKADGKTLPLSQFGQFVLRDVARVHGDLDQSLFKPHPGQDRPPAHDLHELLLVAAMHRRFSRIRQTAPSHCCLRAADSPRS